ncbi:DUF6455 family protein [Actibacterium sp. D379-3]
MFGLTKLDEHADLVQRMADVLGVDLAEEMQAGRLTPEQFRSTVLRCVGCLEAGECQHFLALNAESGSDETPSFCRNKAELEAMRAR